MAKQYTVENDEGKRVTFEWDGEGEPAQEDMQQVFAEAAKFQTAPAKEEYKFDPSSISHEPSLQELTKRGTPFFGKGNIDLNSRPVTKLPDGSIATIRSMGIQDDDGKETLIPTISPTGKVLSSDEAIKLYKETGKHLGKFDSVEDAEVYAKQLHEDQAKLYTKGPDVDLRIPQKTVAAAERGIGDVARGGAGFTKLMLTDPATEKNIKFYEDYTQKHPEDEIGHKVLKKLYRDRNTNAFISGVDKLAENVQEFYKAKGAYDPENLPEGFVENLAYGLVQFAPQMITTYPMSGGAAVSGLTKQGLQTLATRFGPKVAEKVGGKIPQMVVNFAGRTAERGIGGAAGGFQFGMATGEDPIESAKGFAEAEMLFGGLHDMVKVAKATVNSPFGIDRKGQIEGIKKRIFPAEEAATAPSADAPSIEQHWAPVMAKQLRGETGIDITPTQMEGLGKFKVKNALLKDWYTGEAHNEYIGPLMDWAKKTDTPVATVHHDVGNLKGMNLKFGHAGADAKLTDIANIIQSVYKGELPDKKINFSRSHAAGDELHVEVPGVTEAEIAPIAQKARAAVEKYAADGGFSELPTDQGIMKPVTLHTATGDIRKFSDKEAFYAGLDAKRVIKGVEDELRERGEEVRVGAPEGRPTEVIERGAEDISKVPVSGEEVAKEEPKTSIKTGLDIFRDILTKDLEYEKTKLERDINDIWVSASSERKAIVDSASLNERLDKVNSELERRKAKAPVIEKPRTVTQAKPSDAVEPTAVAEPTATAKPTQDILSTLAEEVRSTYSDIQKEFAPGTPEVETAPIEGKVDTKVLMDYAIPMLSVDPVNPIKVLESPKITKGGKDFTDLSHEINAMPITRDLTIPERAAVLRLYDTAGPGLERALTAENAAKVREWIDSKIGKVVRAEKKPILRPSVVTQSGTHVGEPGSTHAEVIAEKAKVEGDRGFTTPDGTHLDREQAKEWIKENQPDVAAELPEGEVHSEPYAQAVIKAEEKSTGVERTALDAINEVRSTKGLNAIEARRRAEAEEVPTAPRTFIEPKPFQEAIVDKPVEEIATEMKSIMEQMKKLRAPKEGEEFTESSDVVDRKMDELEDRYRLLNKSLERKGGVAPSTKVEKPVSNIEKVVTDKIADSVDASVAKRILENPANGISKQELLDSGVSEWLNEQKGTVSKSQLLDIIKPSEGQTLYAFPGGAIDNLKVLKKEIFDPLKGFWARTPQTNEINRIVGKYMEDTQVYNKKLSDFNKTFNKEFPSDRQRAMARYREAGGSDLQLKAWADLSKDPELKKVYEDARHLTENEKAVAEQGGVVFDEGWNEAVHEGILDDSAWVENYFAHLGIERPNAATRKFQALVDAGTLRTNPSFAKRRLFETLFELEQAGFKQKKGADEFGYGMTAWMQSLAEAKAARAAVKGMMKATMPDGRPALALGGGGEVLSADMAAGTPERLLIRPNVQKKDTYDYRDINHPALRKWKWIGTDTADNPILLQGNAKVHPLAFRQVNALLGRSWFKNYTIPSDVPFIGGKKPFQAALGAQAFIKGTTLIGPFHQVTVGEHALFHGVDPFRVEKLNLEGPAERELLSHGLMVFNRNALAEYGEGVHSSGLLQWLGGKVKEAGERRLPSDSPLRKITDKADFLQSYGEYMFQDYIPRLKMAMSKAAVKRAEKWYANDLKSGKITRDQMLDNVAKQANAAFGELNYKYMGRDPSLQDGLRLVFLAPDFLEARLRFAGQALRPYGREQQKALLQGAIITAVVTQSLNTLVGDKKKPNWEKPFTLTVDGKDYSPRSVIGDIWHAMTDPTNFINYRIGPIGKVATEVWTGRDSQGRKLDPDEILADIVKNWTPIPAQGFLKQKVGDTKTSAIMDGVLSSLGIQAYRSLTKAERMLYDMKVAGRPYGGYTEEQKKKMKAIQSIRDKYRDGSIEFSDALLMAREKGIVLSKEEKKDLYMSKETGEEAKNYQIDKLIERRTPYEMMRVWDKMNPEEREIYRPKIIKKLRDSKSITREQKYDMYTRLTEDENTEKYTPRVGEAFD